MDHIDEEFEGALRREASARTADVQLPEPEKLSPDAPAPRLQELVNEYGSGPCAKALLAWQARMMGNSIIAVATDLGFSIDAAKMLINQVHEAVAEDLKEAVALNRSIDLARIDSLIAGHLPKAQQGKVKSAQLVLRCLERRAKLIGLEPMPAPTRSTSQSVMIWLETKMPAIHTIVDSLPVELPPSAP